MKTLLIDTSSSSLYVALIDGENLVEKYEADCKLSHSELLLPTISEVLKNSGVKIGDVDYFSVTVGPGSFTGLRISACTVKAFMLTSRGKAVTCNTLEILAYNYLGTNKTVLSLLDAHHGNAFCGVYRVGTKIEELDLGFFNSEQIEGLKEKYKVDVVISREENSFDCEVANSFNDCFKALTMDKIKRNEVQDDNFEVLYLKRSQAEEELDENT